MGRRTTPPVFLQQKLTEKKAKLVKEHVGPFVLDSLKASNGNLPKDIDLLKKFIPYLADYDKEFKDVPDEAINTRWAGLEQVYGLIKYSSKEFRWSPAKESKAKGKSSAKQEAASEKAKSKSAKSSAKEVVQVTADGHHQGLEEKTVKYYKNINDEADPSDISPKQNQSNTESEPASVSKKSILGKRKAEQAIAHFVAVVKAHVKEDLDHIIFEHDFTKGASKVTTHSHKKDSQA